jgi:hypothetical protein
VPFRTPVGPANIHMSEKSPMVRLAETAAGHTPDYDREVQTEIGIVQLAGGRSVRLVSWKSHFCKLGGSGLQGSNRARKFACTRASAFGYHLP